MTTFFDTFTNIKKNFKLKPSDCEIDNFVFRLNYRITCLMFLVATVLVTSRQYIGEHIKCICDKGVEERVMNTFCFFTSTFTVVKHMDENLLNSGYLAHPGVGPYGINSEEPVKIHAYYQWVPFMLFGQALMFYLPHLIWKKLEGGRLSRLVNGMHMALEPEMHYGKIDRMITLFVNQLRITRTWTINLIFCEILNFSNLFLQVYITHKFLGGEFLQLGFRIMNEGLDSDVDILDKIFPKVTKCTFHKYGASGSLQSHDAMCVMALNVINEKIYAFLWFWFIFLFVANMTGLLWRIVTTVLHAKSAKFNALIFSSHMAYKLNPWKVLTITKYTTYSDWVFLKYLCKNMDPIVFRELFTRLADNLEDRKDHDSVHSDDSDDDSKFIPKTEKDD